LVPSRNDRLHVLGAQSLAQQAGINAASRVPRMRLISRTNEHRTYVPQIKVKRTESRYTAGAFGSVPVLWSIGFMVTFMIGGLTGVLICISRAYVDSRGEPSPPVAAIGTVIRWFSALDGVHEPFDRLRIRSAHAFTQIVER
jgi:hypothetical protein